MASVKILLQGYAGADTGGRSCSTITLVRDGKMKIVCDPGTARSPETIIRALKKERLSPKDINIVFITHSHMDHCRFAGLFTKAKALDYWGLWGKDLWLKCSGKISRNIRMIKTPGHSYDSVTLLVKTPLGVVAVCGDVFWKKGFPKKDKYATEPKKLAQSRRKVLALADFIVPGHGEMFKAKK